MPDRSITNPLSLQANEEGRLSCILNHDLNVISFGVNSIATSSDISHS
jgi:hypothetical protein